MSTSFTGSPWRLPVLMFHHVEPEPLRPEPVHRDSYVTPDELAALLDALDARGVGVLTLRQAADWYHGTDVSGTNPQGSAGHARRRDLPHRHHVVLTFDDACRCFRRHALPLLAARGLGATVFAVSGALGGVNHWDADQGERREELMDAGELAALAGEGVEIGCHGARHVDLSAVDDPAVLERETAGARAELETRIGVPVTSFCYPYGRLVPAARRAVREAGFTAAVAIHDHAGAVTGDPWAVPRLPVRPGESGLELWLKTRGLYPAFSRLPRLGLLRALRGGGAEERP